MIRNSHQRDIILEELQKLKTHPSASMLHEIVKQRLPRVSLATVYRNLELLTRLGKVKKLSLSGEEARYDATLHTHYHVRCLKCGRLDDIVTLDHNHNDDILDSDYLIQGCNLEYYGLCPGCRQEAADGDSEQDS